MAELINVKEAAEYLRLDQKTILTCIKKGKIPAAKVGRTYRIRKADIDALFIKRDCREGGWK